MRERAVKILTGRRDADFEILLRAWDEASPGPVRSGLARILQIRTLLDADAVVAGEGIGYYPKSHMTGIEGECLVCAEGRLAARVDRVLKGNGFVEAAGEVFSMIRRLPGHASHELPALFNLCGEAPFLLLRAPGGKSPDGLRALDTGFRGKKGIWILTADPRRKTRADILKSGSVRPEFLLAWLCDFEEAPAGSEARIAATLAMIGKD
jgi:hypothetical protein